MSLSYSNKPCRQNSSKTPASVHSKKRRCADEDEQIPVAFRAFHWQPVRSTKKIASIAFRSGTRGLWQPRGCFGLEGRRGSIFSQSSSGIRQPSSFTTSPIPTVDHRRDRWSTPTGIGSKGHHRATEERVRLWSCVQPALMGQAANELERLDRDVRRALPNTVLGRAARGVTPVLVSAWKLRTRLLGDTIQPRTIVTRYRDSRAGRHTPLVLGVDRPPTADDHKSFAPPGRLRHSIASDRQLTRALFRDDLSFAPGSSRRWLTPCPSKVYGAIPSC